jgi:hypothetical protein
MRRPPAILGAVLTLALAAVACATSEPASSATGPGSTPNLASPAGPPAAGATVSPGVVTAPEEPMRVPEILRFETPLVGGGTLRGDDLAGAPIALWFWAPW